MDARSREGYRQLVEAQIAEWEKNLANLEHRVAKAQSDSDIDARMARMKSHLPELTAKLDQILTIPDSEWPDFKSGIDHTLEDLRWLQNYVLHRFAAP